MAFNVQCKRCYHLRNDWCKQKLDSPDPDMVRNCLYYKEATNADRIRAMSDEELASWIADIAMCNNCRAKNTDTAKPCKGLYDGCKGNWLDWLKQEARDD